MQQPCSVTQSQANESLAKMQALLPGINNISIPWSCAPPNEFNGGVATTGTLAALQQLQPVCQQVLAAGADLFTYINNYPSAAGKCIDNTIETIQSLQGHLTSFADMSFPNTDQQVTYDMVALIGSVKSDFTNQTCYVSQPPPGSGFGSSSALWDLPPLQWP